MIILYAMIHQRFLLTKAGMSKIADRYTNGTFGTCPRSYCDSAHVLPIGLSDSPHQSHVKIFCPRCVDVYFPPSAQYNRVDGCAWGTTYVHLMFKSYPHVFQQEFQNQQFYIYQPRVFGFRLHDSAVNGLKMRHLRRGVEAYIDQADEAQPAATETKAEAAAKAE